MSRPLEPTSIGKDLLSQNLNASNQRIEAMLRSMSGVTETAQPARPYATSVLPAIGQKFSAAAETMEMDSDLPEDAIATMKGYVAKSMHANFCLLFSIGVESRASSSVVWLMDDDGQELTIAIDWWLKVATAKNQPRWASELQSPGSPCAAAVAAAGDLTRIGFLVISAVTPQYDDIKPLDQLSHPLQELCKALTQAPNDCSPPYIKPQ